MRSADYSMLYQIKALKSLQPLCLNSPIQAQEYFLEIKRFSYALSDIPLKSKSWPSVQTLNQ